MFENLKCSGKQFSSSNKFAECVPGGMTIWNIFKTVHEKFLNWKLHGKPWSGKYYNLMKNSKNEFKKAIQICKRNENIIRNNKLAKFTK